MDKNEFYDRVRQAANEKGMTCELHEDYYKKGTYSVVVSFTFSWNMMTYRRSLIRHIKPLSNGKVNFWSEEIHEGKHHISGPGYYSWPNYDHVYKGKELAEIYNNFVAEIYEDAHYYAPIR